MDHEFCVHRTWITISWHQTFSLDHPKALLDIQKVVPVSRLPTVACRQVDIWYTGDHFYWLTYWSLGISILLWRHKMIALLTFCEGNPPVTDGFPSEGGQWCGPLIFPLMPTWTNCWTNVEEAGAFRCLDAHLRSPQSIYANDTYHEYHAHQKGDSSLY